MSNDFIEYLNENDTNYLFIELLLKTLLFACILYLILHSFTKYHIKKRTSINVKYIQILIFSIMYIIINYFF